METEHHVQLQVFEGPLGLLLFLIRRNEVDIHDIPIVEITKQYQEQLRLMKELDLDVAGEYFDMAATLIRIKTRMLLPRDEEDGEAEDPRKELVDQLLEYQRMVEAAEFLRRQREEAMSSFARAPGADRPRPEDEVVLVTDLYALVAAFADILRRRRYQRPIQIRAQRFTVAEKIELIQSLLAERGSIPFAALFPEDADREEVVTAFLALLELVKLGQLRCYQKTAMEEIRLYPGEAKREGEATTEA